jgi:hypothetical protein
MPAFDLDAGPPEGYVTPAALCRELDVSQTALGKWRAANAWHEPRGPGPPLAMLGRTDRGQPCWFYDRARVTAWAAARGPATVGGKRPGAGRRPRRSPAADGPASDGPATDNRAAGNRTTLEPMPLAAAAAAAERERLEAIARRITDPVEIPALVLEGRITPAEAQTLERLVKQARGAQALKVERGELVDRAQTRRELVEHLARVRTRLASRENHWADRLMTALAIPADRRPLAQAIARQCLADVLDDIRAAEPAAA